MNRYYLHLQNFKGDLLEDEDGADFPSIAAAKKQAITAMHEIVGSTIKRGGELQLEAIVVADAHGAQVAAVPFAAALPSAIVVLLKNPTKVIPPNRFEEYRRNADDCRSKAADATDEDDKWSWLKLADAWLQMLPAPQSGADFTGWPKSSADDSKASH
jgi:hypothetical protein